MRRGAASFGVPNTVTGVSPSGWLKALTLIAGEIGVSAITRSSACVARSVSSRSGAPSRQTMWTGCGKPHRRLEQAIRDDLRDLVGDAHLEAHRPAGRPILERVHQLAAEAEDVVGIAIDDAADVGEDEVASRSLEQFLAELIFERRGSAR